jgi:hypothetical protein
MGKTCEMCGDETEILADEIEIYWAEVSKEPNIIPSGQIEIQQFAEHYDSLWVERFKCVVCGSQSIPAIHPESGKCLMEVDPKMRLGLENLAKRLNLAVDSSLEDSSIDGVVSLLCPYEDGRWPTLSPMSLDEKIFLHSELGDVLRIDSCGQVSLLLPISGQDMLVYHLTWVESSVRFGEEPSWSSHKAKPPLDFSTLTAQDLKYKDDLVRVLVKSIQGYQLACQDFAGGGSDDYLYEAFEYFYRN